jgi:hypothetical protein
MAGGLLFHEKLKNIDDVNMFELKKGFPVWKPFFLVGQLKLFLLIVEQFITINEN